jgi:hypothetical protein
MAINFYIKQCTIKLYPALDTSEVYLWVSFRVSTNDMDSPA